MASVAKAQTSNGNFGNKKEIHRVTYDFSVDAGATGVLTIFTAGADLIITDFMALVKTTCTSAGSMTLAVGTVADDDKFVDSVAVASLVSTAPLQRPPLVEGTPNTSNIPTFLASGLSIIQTIEVAALTAGKIEYVIECIRLA